MRQDIHCATVKAGTQLVTGYLQIENPPTSKEIRFEIPLRASRISLHRRTHAIAVALQGDSVFAMENFGAPLTYFDPLS